MLFNSCVLPPDPHQKAEVNKKAFEKFKKEHSAVPPTVDNVVPSERFEGEYNQACASRPVLDDRSRPRFLLMLFPLSH